MHKHGLVERLYDVTVMDTNGTTHQLALVTPCTCDLEPWVRSLDLPVSADFISYRLAVDPVQERVTSEN